MSAYLTCAGYTGICVRASISATPWRGRGGVEK